MTTKSGTYPIRLGRASRSPPSNFCFDENYDETAAFLEYISSRAVLVQGGVMAPTGKHRSKISLLKRYHDFSAIKRISTSAALVLASIYDLRRNLSGIDQAAVRLADWDQGVRQLMRDLGFFHLLGIEAAVPNEVRENQMITRFHVGVKVDPLQIDGPESVLERLFAFIGEDKAKKVPLYTAIIEAMNNVRDHAYPEVYFHRRKHIKNWWFTGSADRVAKRLTVSFYDQGISIPVSLPQTRGIQPLIANFLEEFDVRYEPTDIKFDAMAVGSAMRRYATTTGLPNRGFGLAKIREMVDQLPGGRLRIISRFGDFVASAGQQPVIKLRPYALRGTLVEIEASFQ